MGRELHAHGKQGKDLHEFTGGLHALVFKGFFKACKGCGGIYMHGCYVKFAIPRIFL